MKYFILTQTILLFCWFFGVFMTIFLTRCMYSRENHLNSFKDISINEKDFQIKDAFLNQNLSQYNNFSQIQEQSQYEKAISDQDTSQDQDVLQKKDYLSNSTNNTKESQSIYKQAFNSLIENKNQKNEVQLEKNDEESDNDDKNYNFNYNYNDSDGDSDSENDQVYGFQFKNDFAGNRCNFNTDKQTIVCISVNNNHTSKFQMCEKTETKYTFHENPIETHDLYNNLTMDRIGDNAHNLIQIYSSPFFFLYTYKDDESNSTQQTLIDLSNAASIIIEKEHDNILNAKIMLHEVFLYVNIFENFENIQVHYNKLLKYNKMFCDNDSIQFYPFPVLIMLNNGNSTIENKIIMLKKHIETIS